MVILQLLLVIGWHVWRNRLFREFTSKVSDINSSVLEMYHMMSLTSKDVEGRELKSVVIRVGRERGVFKFYAYSPISGFNKAKILLDGCEKTEYTTNKIEVITSFIDFVRNEKYRQTIGDLAENNMANNDIIEARQMEVINVLQENLLHPNIGRIHMLVWNNDTAEYLRSLHLKNSEKLILRVTGKDVGLKEQLLYASQCLTDRIIAITNQDNKLGKGWNNTEYHRILRENDIMYALTRHSPIKTNCTWLYHVATCDDGRKHVGSHDTFVLRAKRWNEDVFKEIDSITPDKLGMENVFIWFFQTRLKYRVLNPCKTLFVHHHHCVAIRGMNRPRINTGGKSASIEFTDKLMDSAASESLQVSKIDIIAITASVTCFLVLRTSF